MRRPRPYRPQRPKAITARYARELRAWSRAMSRGLENALASTIAEGRAIEEHLEATRTDSAAWDLDAILRIVDVYFAIPRPLPPNLRGTGQQTLKFCDEQQKRALQRVFSLDVMRPLREQGLIDAWAAINAALIKTIETRYHDQIRQYVVDAHRTGATTEKLAQLIRARGDVSESRAMIIARDQIGKLNGQITQERQTQQSVEGYLWSNAKNETVVGNPAGKYPEATDPEMHGDHWEREGQYFRWDSPPEDGHPGEPILCHCVALPVLPGETPEEVREMYDMKPDTGDVGGDMSIEAIAALQATGEAGEQESVAEANRRFFEAKGMTEAEYYRSEEYKRTLPQDDPELSLHRLMRPTPPAR